jgi:hypothetical protein
MPVTFTENYKEIFSEEVANKIDEFVDDCYSLQDILDFIDANSEEDFLNYYEEYVEQGENLGYDVVDAFVEEFGLSDVENTEKAYVGEYHSKAEFAEEFTSEQYDIPDFVVIDWQATFDHNLCYDFTFANGYVFRTYY